MSVYEEWIIPPRLLNAKQVKPIESRRGEAAASAVTGYFKNRKPIHAKSGG